MNLLYALILFNLPGIIGGFLVAKLLERRQARNKTAVPHTWVISARRRFTTKGLLK